MGRVLRTPASQRSEAHRQAYAQQIGIDGYLILDLICADDAPSWFGELPALETLRRIWVQQYYRTTVEVRWRTKEDACRLQHGSSVLPTT